MNAKEDSTGAAVQQVKALLAESVGNADRLKRSVKALTETLAARMKEIHGHDYRIQIDHTAGIEFVLIVPSLRTDQKTAPKRGEAA